MARFNELSVDLLYVIFSHLQSDKVVLHNLSLSSRLFRDVAQRFLVRNVKISHSLNGSRTKLFLRTLNARPDLISNVHRLELDLLREDIHWPEEQQNIHQITRRLTNLREFCYSSRDYKIWHYSVPQPLKWGREHAHDQVRRVEWDHNMAPWELRKCMELPRIDSIYVRQLQDSSPGRYTQFKVPVRKHKTSTLRALRVGFPDPVALESLKLLLHIPNCLKEIVFESRVMYHPLASPRALEKILEPVRETLEELLVDIQKGMIERVFPPIDLSAFQSLKKLSLPYDFLFLPAKEMPCKIDTRLPSTLNGLEIFFSPYQMEKMCNAPVGVRNVAHNNQTAFRDWLTRINDPNEVPLRMPSLTSITLQPNYCMCPAPNFFTSDVKRIAEEWGDGSLREGGFNVMYRHVDDVHTPVV